MNAPVMPSASPPPLASPPSLAGCASGASIGQVKTNPGRYVDSNVTVHGTVTSSWGIPLVPFKMYQVDDGTGEMLVVSQHDQRIPSKGAQVRVTGQGRRSSRCSAADRSACTCAKAISITPAADAQRRLLLRSLGLRMAPRPPEPRLTIAALFLATKARKSRRHGSDQNDARRFAPSRPSSASCR